MAKFSAETERAAGHSQECPAITLNDVSKSFGATVALDSVSLEVPKGELISLLGPSGSGKTTLLNILAGFLRPTTGKLSFGDRDVTLLPPNKREIGFVFQHYALFPHMTVGQNVAYPLRVRKWGKSEIEKQVQWALDIVQLGGFKDRGVDQLSGGQQQRVALARAIVFEPQIILMDEPLSALDKQLREQMQIELRHLHEKLSATTVYVTHDQREALTLSDRVAVLNEGTMVQLGTPETLYENPANRFAAEFVGETTLLEVDRDGSGHVRLGENVFRTSAEVPDSAKLYLVIRTEKLMLQDDKTESASSPGDDENMLTGVVSEVVYQGESVRIFVELADGTTVSLRRLCQDGELKRTPERGQSAKLYLPPEDAVVVTDH